MPEAGASQGRAGSARSGAKGSCGCARPRRGRARRRRPAAAAASGAVPTRLASPLNPGAASGTAAADPVDLHQAGAGSEQLASRSPLAPRAGERGRAPRISTMCGAPPDPVSLARLPCVWLTVPGTTPRLAMLPATPSASVPAPRPLFPPPPPISGTGRSCHQFVDSGRVAAWACCCPAVAAARMSGRHATSCTSGSSPSGLLLRLGLRRGECVGVLCDNCPGGWPSIVPRIRPGVRPLWFTVGAVQVWRARPWAAARRARARRCHVSAGWQHPCPLTSHVHL